MRVRRYALAAGTHEDVEKADWDIVSSGFSWKGTYRVTARQRGRAHVMRVVNDRDRQAGRPARGSPTAT